MDDQGKIEWDLWCVDGSSVRTSRAAAVSGKKGGSKSPQTTLRSAREADSAARCTLLLTARACSSPRNHRGGRARVDAVQGTDGRRTDWTHVAGDKGNSYPRIQQWLRWHGVGAVIAQRSDQLSRHRGRPFDFDKAAYQLRSVLECCINRLKECRHISTHFNELALDFRAMIKLAIICRYLRVLGLSDRT